MLIVQSIALEFVVQKYGSGDVYGCDWKLFFFIKLLHLIPWPECTYLHTISAYIISQIHSCAAFEWLSSNFKDNKCIIQWR